VDAGLKFIERNPEIYSSEYKGTRRHLIKRFPYKIIYLVEKERKVYHTHQLFFVSEIPSIENQTLQKHYSYSCNIYRQILLLPTSGTNSLLHKHTPKIEESEEISLEDILKLIEEKLEMK